MSRSDEKKDTKLLSSSKEALQKALSEIPHQSGVYLMHEGDLILYVGKAVDLHNRVRQYFQGSRGKSPLILRMVERVEYFEYIVTDSEMEALILENTLIKKHRPPYNTLLKDDKQYPYIKVTVQEAYPRVVKTRQISKDKARYFGPYTSAAAVSETLALMEKLWPLRNCTRVLPRDIGKERPCLNLHIGKCVGPCTGRVSKESYAQMVKEALDLLSGHHQTLLHDLKEKMNQASDALNFEEAAKLRDQIRSIEFLTQSQKLEQAASLEERDVIAGCSEEDTTLIQVFFVRGGKLSGREHFLMEHTAGKPYPQVLSDFLSQFYGGTALIPREILLETRPENEALLGEFLRQKRGASVSFLYPQRGDKAKLLKLAAQNAAVSLSHFSERLRAEEKKTSGAVRELERLLSLEEGSANRIEAYDISNTFGTLSVGSMVVFEQGRPKTSDYRKFRIESVLGPNDYASLAEVLSRRFTHAISEMKQLAAEGKDPSLGSFTRLPDLILMDGGKGQVSVAEAVLQNVGVEIPVCGMVKDDRHRTRGLYFMGKEIDFGKCREAFLLVTRIQDEAHRFAISYHRRLRQDEQVRSALDDIDGIGPARRKALLNAFGSVQAIMAASPQELRSAEGMTRSAADSVYAFFHPDDGDAKAST